MHKDLSDEARRLVEALAETAVDAVTRRQQSLAIAREAMINAFDSAALAQETEQG